MDERIELLNLACSRCGIYASEERTICTLCPMEAWRQRLVLEQMEKEKAF
ncbi:hypothetical protein [Effusibacillus consociatus]|uniref:Uncharacterized protein n=1 Tax=Effusibacillus consociatus TaxID=1117041 RepID=A0ABV9Q3R5_9BACL